MIPSFAVTCCFRRCSASGAPALRFEVTPPPDGERVTLWAHEACFAVERGGAVERDDPRDHGHIPAKARCAFCGGALPRIGAHPYVFDVGDVTPPHRFWAHAPCLLDRIVPAQARALEVGGCRPPERGEPA